MTKGHFRLIAIGCLLTFVLLQSCDDNALSGSVSLQEAVSEYEMGLYSQAAKHIDSYIAQNNKSTNAWLYKGMCQNALGDWRSAVKSFTIAIKADTENTDAYLERAKIYLRIHHFFKAQNDCNKAIELDHVSSAGYALLANTFYTKGDTAQAWENATKALDNNPFDTTALLLSAKLTNKRDPESEGCEYLQKASWMGCKTAYDYAKTRCFNLYVSNDSFRQSYVDYHQRLGENADHYRFNCDQYGYTIVLPNDVVLTDRSDSGKLTFTGKEYSDAYYLGGQTLVLKPSALTVYSVSAKTIEDGIKTRVGDPKAKVFKTSYGVIDGETVMYMYISAKSKGIDYLMLMCLFYHDKNVISINTTCTKKDFAKQLPEYKRALRSVHFY